MTEAGQDARGGPGTGARRGGGRAPRFDLRFEAGRGLLRLARPLAAEPFRLEELELELGRVRFPVDVTGGAQAFRHRRTVVRRARFRVDPRDLCRLAEQLTGFRLEIAIVGDRLSLGVSDQFGALASDLRLFVEGGDLWAWPTDVRCAVEGPSNPMCRLARALSFLGAELDPARGLFRLVHPARRLLARALVARGYRLPASRHAELGLPRVVDGDLWVELGVDEARQRAEDVLDIGELARSCAPLLARLVADDVSGAFDALAGARRHVAARPEADGGPSEAVARWALACAVERETPPGRVPEIDRLAAELGEDPLALSVRLRLRMRTGALEEAATLAETLARVEPVSALATDALAHVARAVADRDPARAHALLTRAAARRPEDADLAVLRVTLAERARDVKALVETARRALSGALSLADRGRVAAAAGGALERLDRVDDAERLFREALHAAPDDPAALEGLAGLFARRGERAEAVVRLDRAAAAWESHAERERASTALRRAAELLVGAGRLSAAEARLDRAVELFDRRPELHCAVARLRAQMGAMDASVAAWERLLLLEGRAHEGLAHALVEAVGFHVDQRDDPRAALPFVEMLRRIAPADARLPALEDRLAMAGVVAASAADLPDVMDIPASAPSPPLLDPVPEALFDAEGPTQHAFELPPLEVVHGFEETDHAVLPEHRSETGPTELPAGHLLVTTAPTERPPPPLPGDTPDLDPTGEMTVGEVTDSALEDAEALRRRADALRAQGDDANAALALGEAGMRARDAATLRGALALAERAGGLREALRIVEMALTVVGEGPARDELQRRRMRIEKQLDPHR